MNERLERLMGRAGLAWAAFIALLWVAANPPDVLSALAAFRESIRAAGETALDELVRAQGCLARAVLVFAALTAAMWAAGREVTRFLNLRRGAGIRREPGAAARILCGWVGASGLAFALASCGLLRTPVLAFLTAGGAVSALMFLRAKLRNRAARLSLPAPSSGPGSFCMAAAVGSVLLAAVCSLAPQTEVDSLIHNLAVAGRALATGNLSPVPDNVSFHVPAPSEMLRAAALALGGEPAGNLLGPFANALTVLLLVGFIAPLAGPNWAWLAAALYAANSLVVPLSLSAKPDCLLAPLGLAALIAVRAWAARASLAWIALSGFLIGGAVAMKYVAAGPAAVLIVLLAWTGGPRVVATVALSMTFPLAPWLVKTWLLTGNPVFPFAHPLLGGLGLTDEGYRHMVWIIGNALHEGVYESLLARLGALFSLTIREGAPPVWLALLPLAFFASWRREPGFLVRGTVLGALGLWMLGPVQFRYLLPVLPAALAAGVLGLARLGSKPSAALAGFLLLAQGGHLLGHAGVAACLPAGAGWEARDRFFSRNLVPYAEALDRIREIGDAGRKPRIACFGHEQGYPLSGILQAPSVMAPFPFHGAIRASATSQELMRRVRQQGVSHVLYNPVHASFVRRFQAEYAWEDRDVKVWVEFWRAHAREVFRSARISERDGFYILYELVRKPDSPSEVAFLPGLEGPLAAVERDLRGGRNLQAASRLAGIGLHAGEFGQFMFFKALVLRKGVPGRPFELLLGAERLGFWDLALWRSLGDMADRLNRPEVAVRARARLQELTGKY